MTKTSSTILAAIAALPAIAGYVQHVPADVSDSRQNFPLRVARGEVVDVSVDFLDRGEPLDLAGAEVTLHTRTNGMDAAESWRTPGVATTNSAVFTVAVDSVLPLPSCQWSVVATRDGRTLARVGGPAYVRGTAAGSVAADPVSALSGYATTGYVARAVADAEPGDYPAVSNAAMRAVQVEMDPTVPSWAKAAQPPAETDPVFVAASNRFIVAEADPVWTAERAGYATTGAVAQVAAGLAGKQDALSAQQLGYIDDVPGKASDSTVVHKTGDETITGYKTFDNDVTFSSTAAAYFYSDVNSFNYLNAFGFSCFYDIAYFYDTAYFYISSGHLAPVAVDGKPGFEVFDGGAEPYYVAFPGASGTLALTSDIPTAWAWSAITNKPTFAAVATSGSYSDLSGRPSLATVATSGSYNDLSNRPAIPSTNGFIRVESDPTVPSWAKAANPPSLAEHDPHVGLTNGTIYIHGQTITPAAGGRTDVASTNAVRYATGVLSLSITSGATVSADLTGWPDGDAVFCHLQAAGSYSAAPSLRLLGYGYWPTNSADVVFARSGSRVLASVLLED